MTDEIAIKIDGVSKTFKLPHEKQSSIKGVVVNVLRRKRTYEKQRVLKNVSFDIKRGEFFGIVGRNGSGKSTLLKMIAGIYTPDSGNIEINGKLTPFIELGVGFNPELTGRENVFLNGALLGFNRKEMYAMYDEIVEFAELEKFMDQKLKNYSSGMQVRLAFSIAIRANSDILLIDEVLAVGDAAFQTKCFEYFMELKKAKKTVILVSHDRGSLERFCTNGILIDQGNIIPTDSISNVLDKYSEIVLNQMRDVDEESTSESNILTEEAIIKEIALQDADGKSITKIKYGTVVKAIIKIEFLESVINPIVGLTIWKKDSKDAIYAANNLTESLKDLGAIKKGDVITMELTLPHILNDGEYSIEIGVANEATTVFYLRKKDAISFRIFGSNNPHSIIATTGNMVLKRNQV
jgi:ABC-2 type transport system ATP-binding protein